MAFFIRLDNCWRHSPTVNRTAGRLISAIVLTCIPMLLLTACSQELSRSTAAQTIKERVHTLFFTMDRTQLGFEDCAVTKGLFKFVKVGQSDSQGNYRAKLTITLYGKLAGLDHILDGPDRLRVYLNMRQSGFDGIPRDALEIQINGITGSSSNSNFRTVYYSWSLTRNASVLGGCLAGLSLNDNDGEIVFQRFDDGWRLTPEALASEQVRQGNR